MGNVCFNAQRSQIRNRILNNHIRHLFKLRRHIALILLILATFPSQHAAAAVTFSNTPAVTSNTYFGPITLQISGLTNGETVVVQKFLDANTNGIVDAGDWLWQQFTLTDGSASVFTNGAILVTNFNVPCDLDGVTNGAITAKL